MSFYIALTHQNKLINLQFLVTDQQIYRFNSINLSWNYLNIQIFST